jgi:hypothetical protein
MLNVTAGLHEPSLEEVIAFGGISCVDTTEVRSSSRIRDQSDADDTQMVRAMKITQQRHDVYSAGISVTPKFSFISLSHSDIVGRASRIGVSLGKTFDETVDSVNILKAAEEERNVHMLEKNIDEITKGDAGPSNLLVSNLSSLCNDLIEDEVDGMDSVLEQSCPPVHIKKVRQRKVYDLSKVRRSTRKRTPKVFKKCRI